jgi:hypothetical protein
LTATAEAPADVAASAQPAPVFIVGCQRSGTTLLRLMLDAHPHISCGPETRFLTDLARVTGDDWRRLSRYGFTREDWHARIAEFFGGLHADYAASRGKERWADKSPRYALAIGFLAEVFPTCQVVHVIRDGRDVVASHRRRWGYWSAMKATVKWPRYIETAREAAAVLPPERSLEVRYEDLVGSSRDTLGGVLSYLGEEWDDAVLSYDQHPHDVSPHYAELTRERRAAAADGDTAVYRNRVGAHRGELDPLLAMLAWVFGRRRLKELGYR